jgi:putative ABC transport system ATP-binding protein
VTVLVAQAISVAFGVRQVLDDVSVTVAPGELVALQGPSGSGKSCLLAVLAGLQAPDSGTVTLDGAPVVVGDDAQRRSVGLLLQGLGLLPLLTAAENVEVPLQVRDEPLARDEVIAVASGALARVGLADRADRLVEELSVGQRQRVALARAVVHRPLVLLADEPTSALDGALRDVVVAMLREEAARGAAVLVATHDPAVVGWADRVLVLHDGVLVSES